MHCKIFLLYKIIAFEYFSDLRGCCTPNLKLLNVLCVISKLSTFFSKQIMHVFKSKLSKKLKYGIKILVGPSGV